MLLELYIKYKKSFSTTPPFDGTKCNVDLLIEDFINQMSVLYSKGHFILGKIKFFTKLELQWRQAPPCFSWDTGRVVPLLFSPGGIC